MRNTGFRSRMAGLANLAMVLAAVLLPFEMAISDKAFAQSAETLSLIEEAREKLVAAEEDRAAEEPEGGKEVSFKEEWQTFTCPSCRREFQVDVGDDIEFKKGLRSMVCPYDGTQFFPREEALRKALREPPTYATIVSPFTGKQFRTKVSLDGIVSGDVIVDPFTGKEFRFNPEEIKPAMMPKGAWQTVVGPDGRMFRVEAGIEEKFGELTSPFDGTPIGIAPATLPLGRKEEFSSIERIFSREIPQTVSRSIKQFGYDIFPESIGPVVTRREERELARGLPSEKMVSGQASGLAQMLGLRETGSVFERGMFAPTGSVPVGSDYILGPDDTLVINIWGAIQQIFPITIDRDGKVMLPKVGPVYLWGMNFKDAEEMIKKKLLEVFTNINVGISMGRLRTIRVFVLGQAKRPGAYILSSQATVFHALYEAGGPSKLGSMRKIKLIRENKTEETIDLYKFLLEGDKSQDYKLSVNDTILIPPIGDVVGIAGNVKQPAIYETTSTVGLNQLLETCGGVNSVGYLQRIQVERVEEHEKKIVLDLEFKDLEDLRKTSQQIELQDGDLVLIFPIAAIRRNYASVTGSVQRPGDYQLKDEMMVKGIIEKAGGLLPDAYMERADLVRNQEGGRKVIPVNLAKLLKGPKEEDLAIKEWDLLIVYSQSEIVPAKFVEIEGAVHKPGRYELTKDMMISDLIFKAGGMKETASLENTELFRMVPGEEPAIMRIDLFKLLHRKMGSADLVLQEGDHLYVREGSESVEKRTMTLAGEFKYAGEYALRKGERLSSIIKRAGGFTEKAYLKGAVFTRKSVGDLQRKMIKKFTDAETQAMLQEESSLALGLSSSQSDARKGLIKYRDKQLRTLETIGVFGRIVISLEQPETMEGTDEDILLEDGDRIYLPVRPSVIQVVGNVRNTSVTTYKPGRGVDYYLAKAGGLTKNADPKGIFIIRANGEAIGGFARIRDLEPGDTIVVPEAFKYKTPPGIIVRDTFQVTTQILTLALAVAALQ